MIDVFLEFSKFVSDCAFPEYEVEWHHRYYNSNGGGGGGGGVRGRVCVCVWTYQLFLIYQKYKTSE